MQQYGASVYGLSRSAAHLDSLKQEVPEINILHVDLQDWEQTAEAVKSIGQVDLLVNNAAVASLESFLDVTPESFDRYLAKGIFLLNYMNALFSFRAFSINVKAIINVSQIVAKNLIQANAPGVIVNISSQVEPLLIMNTALYVEKHCFRPLKLPLKITQFIVVRKQL